MHTYYINTYWSAIILLLMKIKLACLFILFYWQIHKFQHICSSNQTPCCLLCISVLIMFWGLGFCLKMSPLSGSEHLWWELLVFDFKSTHQLSIQVIIICSLQTWSFSLKQLFASWLLFSTSFRSYGALTELLGNNEFTALLYYQDPDVRVI